MKYYLIRNPDGDTTVREFTKEELLAELEEWGHVECLERLEASDTSRWGEDAILIIKGEIVNPIKKEVVTKYDLP